MRGQGREDQNPELAYRPRGRVTDASEDIPMKRSGAGKPAGSETSCVGACIRFAIGFVLFIILCSFPLMTIVAMVVVPALMAGPMAGLLGSCLLLAIPFVYSAWLLLGGDWSPFIRFLPELFDWLRSLGLP